MPVMVYVVPSLVLIELGQRRGHFIVSLTQVQQFRQIILSAQSTGTHFLLSVKYSEIGLKRYLIIQLVHLKKVSPLL